MKTCYTRITRSIVLLFTLTMGPFFSNGQQNKLITIKSVEKTVSEFQTISIESNFDIYIFEGNGQKVIIETEEQEINNVVANVSDGCLQIFRYHKSKESKINNIFITVTELYKIKVSGKCNIKFFYNIEDIDLDLLTSSTKVNLNLKSTKFNCNLFGKGTLILNGNYDDLSFSLFNTSSLNVDATSNKITLKSYDETEVKLVGICETLMLKIYDEASVKAFDLTSKNCQLFVKNSGEAFVSIQNKLEIFGEEDGYIEYSGDPELDVLASKSVKIKHNKENVFSTGK